MEATKATTLINFIHFMNNGGWTKDSARLIYGNEKGGELFRRWAHYTKFMIIDAANTRFVETLTAEELEELVDYADKVAE